MTTGVLTKSFPRLDNNWTWNYESGFLATDVIATGPVQLLGLRAVNPTDSTLIVLAFDAAKLPSNGTVSTFAPLLVPANGNVYVPYSEASARGFAGAATSTGLCWAVSSSAASLTLSASTVWLTARFID